MTNEITFLPYWLEMLWRVSLLMGGAALAGKILFALIDKHSFLYDISLARRAAWFGVLVFITQNVLIQIESFNDNATWIGSALSTIAFILVGISVWRLRDKHSTRTFAQPPNEDASGDGRS